MMFIAVCILSVVVASCKSNTDKVKDLTEEFNKIAEKCENEPSLTELKSLALKFQKLGEEGASLDFLKDLSEEELMEVEGGPELLEAIARATAALTAATANAGAEQFETMGNMINSFKKMESALEENFDSGSSEDEDEEQ